MEEGDNYGNSFMVKFRWNDGYCSYQSNLAKAVAKYEKIIYREGYMPSISVREHRISRLAFSPLFIAAGSAT